MRDSLARETRTEMSKIFEPLNVCLCVSVGVCILRLCYKSLAQGTRADIAKIFEPLYVCICICVSACVLHVCLCFICFVCICMCVLHLRCCCMCVLRGMNSLSFEVETNAEETALSTVSVFSQCVSFVMCAVTDVTYPAIASTVFYAI